jgi:hypothetical protein
MEESHLYANCIAIALDLVKMYIILSGQEDLELRFKEVDMTRNVQSQKKIFKVLCEQIVTLHSHVILNTDITELSNRLLFLALDVPLENLQTVCKALKSHCLISSVLKNFFVTNEIDLELTSLLNKDGELNPEALEDLSFKKLRSSVTSSLQLSVLSDPEMDHFIPSNNNLTVYDEAQQTFTSVTVLTGDKIQVLFKKIVDEIPLTNVEKASLFTCIDRLEQIYFWQQELFIKK